MEKVFFDDAMNVIEGAAAGALGYVLGSFVAGVSSSIGFTQLGSLPLGAIVGVLAFIGIALPSIKDNHNHRSDDEEIKGGGSKYLQYVWYSTSINFSINATNRISTKVYTLAQISITSAEWYANYVVQEQQTIAARGPYGYLGNMQSDIEMIQHIFGSGIASAIMGSFRV